MPIKIPDKPLAIEIMKKENIFVMGTHRAERQDIRRLRIALLNSMPLKIAIESDLLRVVSNSLLQVETGVYSFGKPLPKQLLPKDYFWIFEHTVHEPLIPSMLPKRYTTNTIATNRAVYPLICL